ncbi:MAG: MlaD family protein [Candidatus Cloacimonetes bacterium]|jgi:phospholipid/cholesterol/gamma-HCH transport system substrate-binding protein|nr:MlaD family protein [Candidatus Cloacimonadota bacterium]MCB5288228.1 MlaD family protein [Candidatus Cloacimonadota bacterium]MCK9184663.1 MlaD family protein [Candidatus Cloacimonadota bacterium]MDY0230556.1 MlaD family protein [Candidatus Cloacimonadaceae bacterium]
MAKFYKHLRSTRIKTGLWTLAIFLILLFGYLWLTNRLDMRAQQNLRVLFTDVIGLETGDKIMFRGMEAGRVKTVSMHEDGILVAGKISTAIQIPVGSRFYIEDSLMGSKSLNIQPAAGNEYLDLAQIQAGEQPSGMMSIIAKAAELLSRLDGILADVDAEGGLIDQGERLLQDTGSTVRNANRSITELKGDISTAINRVDSLTQQINSFVAENKEPLRKSIALTPAVLGKVNSALDSLSVLSAKLNHSADALASGQGSAGKLLTEDDLYQKLLNSIDKLDDLIADIKANPRKYIKLSIF